MLRLLPLPSSALTTKKKNFLKKKSFHFILLCILVSKVLIPDLTDMDSEYIWCRFRRPLLAYGPTAINPGRAMFHYYFKGPKNQSGNLFNEC